MDVDFAQITTEVLEAYDYSEAYLANLLGISQATVNRLKTGKHKEPGSYMVSSKLLELHRDRPHGGEAA